MFLPQKITRCHRLFSCTPDHPILGVVHDGGFHAPVSAEHFVIEHQQKQQDTTKRRRTLNTSADAEVLSVLEPIPMPVPYRLPPRRYGSGDIPWVWDRNYLEPDAIGGVWLPGGDEKEL